MWLMRWLPPPQEQAAHLACEHEIHGIIRPVIMTTARPSCRQASLAQKNNTSQSLCSPGFVAT
ncbi:MAG: hypothetical protein QOF70_1562, partial [Acetobacteraceae bacterium]|nr:hypothetical protein [Acetobacteraceae bacterium]